MAPKRLNPLLAACVLAVLAPSRASAHDEAWEEYHRYHHHKMMPGGHLAVAVPIVQVAHDSSVIGDDFVDLGLAAGVGIPFNRCWSFDLEMVMYDHLKSKRGPTTFLLDPGVIYHAGPWGLGLRTGMNVGDNIPNNFGLIPLINFGCPICQRANWYVELDLPVFVNDGRNNRVTFTPQVELGVKF